MSRRKAVAGKRVTESLAMMMIGDGMLALLDTKRHLRLWENGPRMWRRAMRAFIKRPAMTRGIAVGELALGLWLAASQQPRWGR